MNKKVSLGATIALAAVAVVITFTVTVDIMTARFNDQMGDMQAMRTLYSKLQEIGSYVNDSAYFMPDDEIRHNNIAGSYAYALYEAGDKYARYYTAEEYEAYRNERNGLESGIGISVLNIDETVYVYNCYKGSSAYEAGIRAGQTIVSVSDGEGNLLASQEDGYDKLITSLDGKTGESYMVTVANKDGSSKEVSVTKEEYSLDSVTLEYVGDIAVVRIYAFNSDTDEDFISVIDTIESEKIAKGIVFDVRNNGGGMLATVVNMLDRLLPEGVILTETDRDGNEKARFESDATKVSMPMAVLVNGSSASAAELFACALRDYNKADLVGEATYGKGCVQTTYVLGDGSAICFTTAMYNPPSSGNFDGKPLQPDVFIELTEEQERDFYSLTSENDPQLKEALIRAATNRMSNTNVTPSVS